MPLPAVVLPGVLAAVGRASPTIISRATAFLGSRTASTVSGASGLIGWAKRSPAGAALVAASLVDAGVTAYDIFGKDTEALKSDPETSPMMEMLATTAAAAARVQSVLDGQADVKLNLGDLGDQMVGKRLVSYLRSKYGAVKSIKDAHMYERMFVELNEQSLDQLLAQYA